MPILFFADDAKVFNIDSIHNYINLQEDLRNINNWCNLNGLCFNISKCKIFYLYFISYGMDIKHIIH